MTTSDCLIAFGTGVLVSSLNPSSTQQSAQHVKEEGRSSGQAGRDDARSQTQ